MGSTAAAASPAARAVAWTETHHVITWHDGGPTDIDFGGWTGRGCPDTG